MDEQKLIAESQNGNVESMLQLAKYYAKKSKGGGLDDKVGDVISMEDFLKNCDDDEDKNNSRYEKQAYKYFRMAADAGNADAMLEVGRRLYDGIGVEKNNEESQIFYRRAAEAGNAEAMHVVAHTSEDAAEKFKYYKLSAELLESGLNKIDSMKKTAISYVLGRGTEQNSNEAERWFNKMGKDNAAEAMLQIFYETQNEYWLKRAAKISISAMIKIAEKCITENDFGKALEWYKKSVAKKSQSGNSFFGDQCAESMSLIGDIYYIGEGNIPQDYEEAFQWYEMAAERDYNTAKIKYALMLYRGLGVKQNLKRAFDIFEEISWSREKFFGPFRFNSVARYYAAKMKENGEGCEKDLDEAIERYKLCSGARWIGRHDSSRMLGAAVYKVAEAYFLGRGVKQNFSKALKFYEKAFDVWEWNIYKIQAAKKIMLMYELGEGIPQDKIKAEQWRKKIAKLLGEEQ